MLEHYDTSKKIKIYFIVSLLVISFLYSLFRIYPLVAGPIITIYNPIDGSVVSSTTFEISGKVVRAKEITLQGRLIPIGVDGHFTEILLAQSPYTIIVLTAKDFYGNSVIKTLKVIPK